MYPWLVTVHLLGLVLFLATHGVSMWVAFRVRRETSREVIGALLAMSKRSNQVMYLGLLLLGLGGLAAAAQVGWLTASWIVASYVVVIVVLAVMYAVGAGYYYRLRDGLEGTDGTPRLDDAALASTRRTRRPEVLAAVGGIGLALLVWLMAVKPG